MFEQIILKKQIDWRELMRYYVKRTYPVTYKKRHQEEEKSIDLSLAVAAGLLAFTFVKGVFWGYMVRKWLDKY